MYIDMAGLQRSVTSYRKQGSSGLVWDDKFIAKTLRDLSLKTSLDPKQELGEVEHRELIRLSPSVGTFGKSSSNGTHPYRKTISSLSNKDPPSPKVATCGLFCGMFGQPTGYKFKPRERIR